MKYLATISKLMFGVLLLAFSASASFGQVLFENELRSGIAPDGWTATDMEFRDAAGGYALLNTETSQLTSPSIDLSGTTEATLTFQVAKFGSGEDGPLTVEVSTDGGTTWDAQTYTSPIPTNSDYLKGEMAFDASVVGEADVTIRFNKPDSPSAKRLRDVVIVGPDGISLPEPTDVSTITDLRNGTADGETRYRLTGEALVHFSEGYQGRRMLVDGTAGIWSVDFDDNFAAGTTIGDGITGLVGTLEADNNGALLRFILDEGSADATVSSTDNTIDPETITIPDLSLEDTGKLVLIEGVTFQETGTFDTGTNYTLEDASGNTLTFRTDYFGADYIDGDIPTTPLNIVGVVGGFGSSPQIFARSSADFEESAAVANLQIIHNSADPAVSSVDIYVDGNLTLEDVAFRSATGFIEFSANTSINIGVTPTGESLESGVTFENVSFDPGNYYVVATGVLDPSGFQANPSGEDIEFFLDVIEGAETSAPDEDTFSFRINHGVTDAPAVDVFARGDTTPLAEGAIFGTTTADYTNVPVGSYTIDVAPAGGDVIASFEADANEMGGETALILASGFLTPGDDQDGEPFSALLVRADGTTAPLPTVSTSIDEFRDTPKEFALEQNYPNPFNPSTKIEYALPQAADVQIAIYNVVGQRVATLLNNEQQSAGFHSVSFDASSLSSGMYLYRIQAGNFTQTRKMTLIK